MRPLRWLLSVLVALSSIASQAPLAQAVSSGNAGLHVSKTVEATTLDPVLKLSLQVDKPDAIPGDVLTYSGQVTSSGATLGMAGHFTATSHGDTTSTVAYYWDQIEYCLTGCGHGAPDPHWTPLVAFVAVQPGYVPVLQPGASSGITLVPVGVPAPGVTYPTSGDPVLGTQIGPNDTASWTYKASVPLTSVQIALLADPNQVQHVRNVVHFEVTPRTADAAQPWTDVAEFVNPLQSRANAAAASNVSVAVTLPSGAQAQITSSTVPGLASLAPGASAAYSTTFSVPVVSAKGATESDTDYLSRLGALDTSKQTASATASGTGFSGPITATAPGVSTVEHVPVVHLTKSGPSTVDAGTTETNPLAFTNSGSATASGLAITDTLPGGATGAVSGAPAQIAAGAAAMATATYPVPAGQAAGTLTDTAAVTWQDANKNAYGPVSSSFTTNVRNSQLGSKLTLEPAAATNVTGAPQTMTATLFSVSGAPVANQVVTFSVSGPNATSGTGTTNASGAATFTFQGAHSGTDTVQATANGAGGSLQSNVASIGWITPIVPVSTNTVKARFFHSDGSGVFGATPDQTPVFTQSFPTINFNPPAGTIPFNNSGIGVFSRPMADVTTDVVGNFTGAVVAQGTDPQGALHQAGSGDLFVFNAVFTSTYTVAAAGDVTFNFFSDDGFMFAAGGGATRVSGPLVNPPASGLSPFEGYPILGTFNVPTAPVANNITVHFPAAGSYPYEIDYSECCGGQLALTMATGGKGVPPTGNLALTPFAPPTLTVGHPQSFVVAAMDASGKALPNIPVALSVTGANSPQLAPALTDASGLATFTYQASNAGTDQIQGSAMVSGVPELSNTVSLNWNPAPPAPSISAPSLVDGTVVTRPTPITANIAPPSGQSIVSWSVTYQALDPGPVTTIASGSGTPPTPLATFDPTVLANDTYAVTVNATASGGGVQSSTSTVAVMGNLKLGRYSTTSQDLRAPVAGYDIQVLRVYDSLDKSQGDFGQAWRLHLGDFRVAPNRVLGAGGWTQYNVQCFFGLCVTAWHNSAPRFVTVTFPDQHTEVFDFTPNGGTNIFFTGTATFTARPGTGTTSTLAVDGDASISYNGDGNLYGGFGGPLFNPQHYVLTTLDGHVLHLDTALGLVSESDASGNTLNISSSGVISSSGPSITFDRDSAGRIVRIHGPTGQLLQYTYTPAGDLAAYIDANGVQTSFSYDSQHELLQVTGPNGPVQTLTYSGGRLVSVTDANGNTTQISNDVGSQTQTVVDPNQKLTSLYTYDALGDLLQLDRVFGGTKLSDTWTYDAVGHITSHRDPNGALTQAQYDGNGNLTRVTNSRGDVFDYAYNAFGQVISVNLNGAPVQSYTYDSHANLTQWDRPDGTHITYVRNAAGLPTQVTDAAGRNTFFTYDANGHLAKVVDNAGNTTFVTADASGRVTKVSDAAGGVTQYTYDNFGNVASLTDNNQHNWQFQWDNLGNMVKLTDPKLNSKSWTYDAAGLLRTSVDRDGRTIQFQYDADGHVISKTLPGGVVTSYTYDPAGRLTEIANPDSDVHFTLDAAGNVTQASSSGTATSTQPSVSLSYAYDTEGNRTSLTTADGTSTYAYDPWGQLTQVSDPVGRQFVLSHDAEFRYTGLQRPNSVNDTLTYDGSGALTGITSPARSLSYQLDPLGRTSSQTTSNGTSTFARDATGRLTSAMYPGGSLAADSFQYDGVGNRVGTGQTYDAANHLLSSGGTAYAYDKEGHLTSRTDATGTTTYDWNADSQLLAIHFPDGTLTSYRYDGFGRRIEMNAADAVTRYVYDGDNIHLEYDGGNTLRASYIDGDGADQLLEMNRAGQPYYYLRDRVGSIIALVDSSGAVVDSYDYSAFGAQSATASVPNPFTYTGREYDSKSGLYYYRSRYYDPAVGRFLSEDPLPATNLYPYAANDPVTFNDPLGQAEMVEYAITCEEDTEVFVYAFQEAKSGKCYIGISNNLGRRFLQHGGPNRFSNWAALNIPGLNRLGARGLEQSLIEARGGAASSGLLNRINSIASSSEVYGGAVAFGNDLIDAFNLLEVIAEICGP